MLHDLLLCIVSLIFELQGAPVEEYGIGEEVEMEKGCMRKTSRKRTGRTWTITRCTLWPRCIRRRR